MATLLAHVHVQQGHEEEFESIARQLYELTHEHEHVLRYEYWRARTPGHWYVLESFESYEGFLAHQASPHHERFSPRLREILAGIDLEWLDPLPGASPLPPTRSPAGDPGDLARRYPLELAPWWSTL